jgi:carbonic anhydrase
MRYSTMEEYLTALEHQSVVKALDNLMTFPYVRARVERKTLSLHGAYFDVSTGLLSVYDPDTKTFASAAGAAHNRNFSQPRF